MRTARTIPFLSSLLAAPVGAEVVFATLEEVAESAAAITFEEPAEMTFFCGAMGACVDRESREAALVVIKNPCSLYCLAAVEAPICCVTAVGKPCWSKVVTTSYPAGTGESCCEESDDGEGEAGGDVTCEIMSVSCVKK